MMRTGFFLVFMALLSQALFSQELSMSEERTNHCNRAFRSAALRQVQYLQYSAMEKYDQKFMRLAVDVQPGSRVISGNVTMTISCLQALDSFVLELKSYLTADSVFINGSQTSFLQENDHLVVPISTTLVSGSIAEAKVFYHGTAGNVGMYAGSSSGLTYTASLSESYQAREWYPAKQILTDKFDSVEVWITTSIGNKAGSNGLLVDSVDVPGGKRQFRWKTRYPINYYLPSIAVGNYREYRNYAKPSAMAPDSIPIINYINSSSTYLNSVKTNLDKTPRFLEAFSDLYGLYPFKDEKYGHCQANIGGGMEHQTMSTMQSFGSTLIAHELGHQWWGDHVTCARWNDIWLNEGFASYSEYLAIEKLPALFATTNPTSYMTSVHNNVMSSTTGSVYVPDASLYDENRIFSSRLSYDKGSAIVHNLRFEMGNDNVFFQALQNFQQQYANATATTEDFKTVAEAACGKNLDDFFNQWYYGEGYPTFNITYLTQGTDSLILIINETVSAPTITPFFKGLLELKITSPQGDTTVVVNLATNNQQFKFPYRKTPGGIVIDPNNWMLNKNGQVVYGGAVRISITGVTATTDANCNNTLKWTITNELPGTRYQVESSTDGRAFVTLTNIAGNNQGTYIYQFPMTRSGITYLRIKVIEANGNSLYSNQISITNNCVFPYQININPNPANEIIKASIQVPAAGNHQINIFNATGELLLSRTDAVFLGKNYVTISLKSLPKGTYILSSFFGSEKKSIRFVKM